MTSKENDEAISKDINISIYDGNDNKVYNENIKSSDYGIVSGKFELANEVNSGLYKLVVKSNENETTKLFKVNPYVTPKYEVKVDYSNLEKLKYYAKTNNISITKIEYLNEIICNIQIPNEDIEKFLRDVEQQKINIIEYKEICEKYILK